MDDEKRAERKRKADRIWGIIFLLVGLASLLWGLQRLSPIAAYIVGGLVAAVVGLGLIAQVGSRDGQ